MRVITGRNVNELWPQALRLIESEGVPQASRAGEVLVAPHPVMSVYARPQERVLLDPVRDANPFFHLMESLWMLAGRDDAAFLNMYVRDFGQRFAEPDGTIHGAYGYRWRKALGIDQLEVVIEKLRKNPDDRQCVIQMWDATNGGGQGFGEDDLHGGWRDRPCNTHVYLRVRAEPLEHRSRATSEVDFITHQHVLDLTVCCRSNDIVWGAYGANAVHFSVLQEYLAGRIGVGVGTMYQLSNNWHAYRDVILPILSVRTRDPDEPSYGLSDKLSAAPIGDQWDRWDEDLEAFVTWAVRRDHNLPEFWNQWFANTAARMHRAHLYWRSSDREKAYHMAGMVESRDWSIAAQGWMQRRLTK